MKKQCSLLCVTALVLTLFASVGGITANAEEPSVISYTLTDGEVTIVDFEGHDAVVIVPSTIDKYPVTAIGDYAFADCTSLQYVELPDSVDTVGADAFAGCTALETAVLSDRITVIEEEMFLNCHSLKQVNIPDGVTTIGNFAFYKCSSLTSIDIPYGVTTIGLGSFESASMLDTIILPDSVTSVGSSAFYDTAYYNTAENRENGVLYIGNHLIEADPTLSGCYTVKPGTKTIADFAFFECDDLEDVLFPDSVVSIGIATFSDCTALKEMVLPDSVTVIGDMAFMDCTALERVTMGNGVQTIGTAVWRGCPKLNTIDVAQDNAAYRDVDGVLFTKDMQTLVQYPVAQTAVTYAVPSGVKTIGHSAFYGCTSLRTVICPATVTTIDILAFSRCTSLRRVMVPATLQDVKMSAFDMCSSLGHVYYGGTKEQWQAVTIDISNPVLDTATIHYNYALSVGDVNADFAQNMMDVSAIYFTLSGTQMLNDVQKAAADVSGDGIVNMMDVLILYRQVAGSV